MTMDKAVSAAGDEVIDRLTTFLSSREDAVKWYQHHKIRAFDNLTSEALVKKGLAEAVISYIDGIDAGVHA